MRSRFRAVQAAMRILGLMGEMTASMLIGGSPMLDVFRGGQPARGSRGRNWYEWRRGAPSTSTLIYEVRLVPFQCQGGRRCEPKRLSPRPAMQIQSAARAVRAAIAPLAGAPPARPRANPAIFRPIPRSVTRPPGWHAPCPLLRLRRMPWAAFPPSSLPRSRGLPSGSEAEKRALRSTGLSAPLILFRLIPRFA